MSAASVIRIWVAARLCVQRRILGASQSASKSKNGTAKSRRSEWRRKYSRYEYPRRTRGRGRRVSDRPLSERDSFWTWRDGDSITFLENTITRNGERFEVVPEGKIAALEAENKRLRMLVATAYCSCGLDNDYLNPAAHPSGCGYRQEEGGDG